MRITLNISKSLEKNAEAYFERAKKARRKIDGARAAAESAKRKIEILKKQELKEIEKERNKAPERKKHWYEKFRWFITSDGFLVIGGRDATTNEIVIKKHADPDDYVLHTDMAGSPFFVIKSEGRQITETAVREAADATCSFSRAWKLGLAGQSVFYVKPEQVTKTAKSGEYLTKGAFVINGKVNYAENRINCAIGATKEGAVMAGPVEAVKFHCEKYSEIAQGDEKLSKIAKQIQHKIGGDLDEIVRAMPSGGIKLKKQ